MSMPRGYNSNRGRGYHGRRGYDSNRGFGFDGLGVGGPFLGGLAGGLLGSVLFPGDGYGGNSQYGGYPQNYPYGYQQYGYPQYGYPQYGYPPYGYYRSY